MKKRTAMGRGLLAASMLAAAGGALALWAGPASAAGAPQIAVATGHAGTAGAPTPGHPKTAAHATLSAGYVAYNPANGDEAVSVVTKHETSAHVYLIPGHTEADGYHINLGTTNFSGTLQAGQAYLVAGTGVDGMTSDPGAGTTTVTGQSPTVQAIANNIAPISLAFDKHGNLLIAESHPNTGPTRSGIQMVAKTSCSSACAYGYGTLAAGGLYTLAAVAWQGSTNTPAITYTFQVNGFSMTVDAAGDIIVGANGNVVLLNETGSSISRYGLTLAAHAPTTIAGTATSGSATCGNGNKTVSARGPSAPNLNIPHPYVDSHTNVYVNDNNPTAHEGCTWVLPAATGTLDGQTVTAGDLTSLTGAQTTTAAANNSTAAHSGFPTTAAVAVDGAGNVVLGLSGTTPEVAVIAESTGSMYGQSMQKGDAYIISGGSAASRTTAGNATGFKFAGAARTHALPEFGLTSLTAGATGDLLLTDGATATTESAYLITGGPTPPSASISTVAPPSGSTTGGTLVTISGANLTGATHVKFGTSTGTTIAADNGTSLTVKTPPHSGGPVSVSVTTSTFGTATKATAFTFTGPVTTHVTLTVSGTKYTGAVLHLVAHVSPPTAVGNVTWTNADPQTYGPVNVSGGIAQVTTTPLPAGPNQITAFFHPTTVHNFLASTSGTTGTSAPFTAGARPATGGTVRQPMQVTVAAGRLTLSCTRYATVETPPTITTPALGAAIKTCPLITFPKVQLNGVQQTETEPMNAIYVYTARGTASAGWALSAAMVPTVTNATDAGSAITPSATCAAAADFCDSTGNLGGTVAHGQIPAKDLTLSAGYTCTPAATNANPTPPAKTHGTFNNTTAPKAGVAHNGVLVLCAAAPGTSGGKFKVTGGNFKLTIPSTVRHGKYFGTVEYTLASIATAGAVTSI